MMLLSLDGLLHRGDDIDWWFRPQGARSKHGQHCRVENERASGSMSRPRCSPCELADVSVFLVSFRRALEGGQTPLRPIR